MSEKTADLMVRMLQGVVDGVYNPHADINYGYRSKVKKKI